MLVEFFGIIIGAFIAYGLIAGYSRVVDRWLFKIYLCALESSKRQLVEADMSTTHTKMK